ncbi:TRAP transporter substrate-binding protein [Clostridium malenominatum]|uniref:TRAP transporter substrate-binding protein n=1 Tax=Clostridium malenominatum TaxID=1539 RepID=A0ABN1IS68_9CLOT
MKKRAIYPLLLLLVVSLILSACSNKKSLTTKTEQITLTLGAAGQTSLPAIGASERFAELVAEKTNNRIKIKFFPSRQLGDDDQLIEQVMIGAVDIASISTSSFSKFTPLLQSLQMPFLLNSYEKEYKAITSKEMQDIYKKLEELNIKTLSIYDNGIRHFANVKRPINNTSDLKGLKLRVPGSKLLLDSVKALGANPTPMAYGEIYTGLQTKVIDGEEINLTSIYSEKHYEVLDYVSTIGLWPFPASLCMNLEAFNKLSPEDRKIIQDCADEGLKYNMNLFEEKEKTAIKAMEEKGVKINKIDNTKPFVEATEHIYEEYMAKDPLIRSFVNMAREIK